MKNSEVEAMQGALSHIGLTSEVAEIDGERVVEFEVPAHETEEQCRSMLVKVESISAGYYAMNIDIDVGGEKRPGIRVMKNKLFESASWVA